MRRGDAKPRRAAPAGTVAERPWSARLCRRALPAQRRSSCPKATSFRHAFASAWLRARPASSTSGTSARRSSTGCSRVTTEASSGCGSRTPTPAARSRRRPSRSRSRCAGSDSTGTATSPSSSTAWVTARKSHGASSRRTRPTKTRARSGSACPTRGSRPGTTPSAVTSSSRTRSSRTSCSSVRMAARPTTSPRRWRMSGTGSRM